MTLVRNVRGRPIGTLIALAAVAAIVAGCTGTTSASAVASALQNASLPPIVVPAPSSAAPSAAPSAPASAAPSGSAEPTAVATDIDPCTLVTSAEASALAGVTFGAGKESTTKGNARICTYGAQTPNVFMVIVAIAPDEATAQADEAAAKADIQKQAKNLPGGMKVTDLTCPSPPPSPSASCTSFAPNTDAELFNGTAKIGGQTIGGSALYMLRGTTFAGFSDLALNAAPPSDKDMEDMGMTVLGRVP
jgi:hypothetical protein